MKGLIVYTSQPASLGMASFLMAVSMAHDVAIRPLTDLPQPDAQRRQNLRVERDELLQSITMAEFSLEQYRSGQWQPDHCHESSLHADLAALQNRLSSVNTVLGTPTRRA